MGSPFVDKLVDGQLAELEMISPAKQQAITGSPFNFQFSFVTVPVAMEDLLHTLLYHTVRINQMGYKS